MLQSKLLELAVHQNHEEDVLLKLAEQLQKAQANLVNVGWVWLCCGERGVVGLGVWLCGAVLTDVCLCVIQDKVQDEIANSSPLS